jgi:hypothetical protein
VKSGRRRRRASTASSPSALPASGPGLVRAPPTSQAQPPRTSAGRPASALARPSKGDASIWFRPVFAFFIIDVNSRRVVHVAVTRAPTRQWTAQQLRNATPFGQGPRFLIRDRDDKFGPVFDRVAKGAGTSVLRTAVQARS